MTALGDVVEARSSLRSDGSLVATSVELASVEFGDAGERVEIEGYISSPFPMTGSQPETLTQLSMRFSVERLNIETTGTTTFVAGSWANLWHDAESSA